MPAKVLLPYLLLSSVTASHTFLSPRVVPVATANTGQKAADHLTVVTPDVLCLLHREDRFKDREFGALAVGHRFLVPIGCYYLLSKRKQVATANTGRKAADHLTVVTPDVLCLLHREDRFKDREFGALAVGHRFLVPIGCYYLLSKRKQQLTFAGSNKTLCGSTIKAVNRGKPKCPNSSSSSLVRTTTDATSFSSPLITEVGFATKLSEFPSLAWVVFGQEQGGTVLSHAAQPCVTKHRRGCRLLEAHR
ncbi:hypothetical protein ZIOFF_035315 [Zingiber officinale]|uniref:Uncharacterized protein n=1 Tax=Zingiber officinale TaxID=94328 RepID=A0A8J5GBU8_ZINOF|nr:hypothetical protein ZIOFF_035315 [Zingiber officinale]